MMHSCIIFLCFLLVTFTNAEWRWLPNERAHMQGGIDRDNPTPPKWNGAPITVGITSIRPSQSRASNIPITMDTRHDQQYGADDVDDDDMLPQIYMEPETTYIPYISSSTAAGVSDQIVSSFATSEATSIPTSTSTPPLVTPTNDTYTETFRQYVTHLHDMWCQWMTCNIPTSVKTQIPNKTTTEKETTPTTPPTSTTPIATIPTTPITPIPATNIGSSIDVSRMDDIDTSTNDPIHHNIHDNPIYDDVYDGDEETFFPSTTPIPSVDEEDVNVTSTVLAYESMDVPSDVAIAPIQSMTTTTTEYTDDDIFPEMTSFALDTSSQSDTIASSQSDPFTSACSMISAQLSYTRWWLCFFSAIFCLLLFILLRLEWMQQHDKHDDMEIGEKEILIEKEISSHYRLLPTQVIRGSDAV